MNILAIVSRRRLTAIVGRGRGHDGIEYGAVCCEPVLLIPIRPLRVSSRVADSNCNSTCGVSDYSAYKINNCTI